MMNQSVRLGDGKCIEMTTVTKEKVKTTWDEIEEKVD